MRARLAGLPPNHQGRDQIVVLGTQGFDPARGDVEDWLREQDAVIDRVASDRHQQQMNVGRQSVDWAKRAVRWARCATILSAVSLGIAALSLLAAVVFGILSLPK